MKRGAVFLSFLVVAGGGSAATAAGKDKYGPGHSAGERSCIDAVARGRGPVIACAHPAWLTDNEKADLARLTRGTLKDARCTVDIEIERRLIEVAMADADSVFQSPKQSVRCVIATSKGAVAITGTFAPRVVFKGGKAAEATPGLADVAGVSGYLSWPVVQYVNRAPGIRAEMARLIDLHVARLRRKRSVER